MVLEKIPSAIQLGNVVLGAVDAFDLKRLEQRQQDYSLVIANLDAFLALPTDPPSKDYLSTGVKTIVQAVTDLAKLKGMSAVNTAMLVQATQQQLAEVTRPRPRKPVEPGAPVVSEKPRLSPHSVLRSYVVKIRSEADTLRAAELAQLADMKVRGGQSGISAMSQPGGPSIGYYLTLAMVAGCAYHGYRRGGKVTSALLWSAAPIFTGFLGGAIALSVAAAQGFGKPAVAK
jgi:hypothetical protein